MRITLVIILALAVVPTGNAIGCATTDLISSEAFWDSGGVILTRPENQHSWITPDDIFVIHYDTAGPFAVYHPDEDLNPIDGIPDYVNRCADFLHRSYEVIIMELGYDPPPDDGDQGGDFRYDVYLTNVLALTTPESPSDQYPGRPAYTSYIQLGHDMRIPRYPDDPYPFLKVSAAHEYFHAVQFAYRAYSMDSTPWWFESCAVWMEEIVFDDINDGYFQIPEYFDNLHMSLYQTPGPFIYGAWLFPEFLSEHIGDWIVEKCWEKFAGFDHAMEAIKLSFDEAQLSLNTEYTRHIVWNYFSGGNFHEGFYEEGESFPASVEIAASHDEYPVPWTPQPIDQQNVSGAYIEFLKPEITKGSLVIEYFNPTEDQQYLAIAVVRQDGSVPYDIYKIHENMSPSFIIDDFAGCEKAIMMPVWAYEGHPVEGTTLYSYRAHIDSTSTPIVDGPAAPSDFRLEGAYPNPFNGSVILSFQSPCGGVFRVDVYDILGNLVMEKTGSGREGVNRVNLDFTGRSAGGVFLYTVKQGDRNLNGKILYLK